VKSEKSHQRIANTPLLQPTKFLEQEPAEIAEKEASDHGWRITEPQFILCELRALLFKNP
jgi:hypothetical protein